MEALTLFYKTRISHSPSDKNHSVYWLEEHTIICRLQDRLTLHGEPLVQAPITQVLAPGGDLSWCKSRAHSCCTSPLLSPPKSAPEAQFSATYPCNTLSVNTPPRTQYVADAGDLILLVQNIFTNRHTGILILRRCGLRGPEKHGASRFFPPGVPVSGTLCAAQRARPKIQRRIRRKTFFNRMRAKSAHS
jgi:hypothetical protein